MWLSQVTFMHLNDSFCCHFNCCCAFLRSSFSYLGPSCTVLAVVSGTLEMNHLCYICPPRIRSSLDFSWICLQCNITQKAPCLVMMFILQPSANWLAQDFLFATFFFFIFLLPSNGVAQIPPPWEGTLLGFFFLKKKICNFQHIFWNFFSALTFCFRVVKWKHTKQNQTLVTATLSCC